MISMIEEFNVKLTILQTQVNDHVHEDDLRWSRLDKQLLLIAQSSQKNTESVDKLAGLLSAWDSAQGFATTAGWITSLVTSTFRVVVAVAAIVASVLLIIDHTGIAP